VRGGTGGAVGRLGPGMEGLMERHCAGSGLILAGLIVTTIGAALVLREAFDLPRHWLTFGVGLALLAAGALRAVWRRPER
jgi:hypothetical protein